MRIADKMSYDQVNRAISKNRSEMNNLQNQAATQKRVNRPSDDPVAASRVLFARVEQRGSEQFVKNLNYAKSFLDYSEQSLSELTEVMVRAKELAISQANDASASPQTRRIVAEEIKQLYNQAVQIGNRKLGERFIFAGFKTTDAPFDENGNYKGDLGEMKIHIEKNTFLPMNLPGVIVFHGKGLSSDGFTFKSLKQAETVDELRQQMNENPDSYARGQQQANDEAQVNGRGPASLRAAQNAAPQVSAKEGLVADGVNIFSALKKMEVALMTDDKVGVQESMDRLDDGLQQIVMARTSLGSRVMNIENTLNSLHTNIVDNKTAISQFEDADAFEVISDINKTDSALQATLQTSGKLIQKSLLDFIS